MKGRSVTWLCVVVAFALWAAAPTFAQRGGGPPGGGGPGGGGPGGGGSRSGGPGGGMQGGPGGGQRGGIPGERGGNRGERGGIPGSHDGSGRLMRSSQLGPVGRWWDDKSFAQTLNLRPEQKQKMDAIFNASRNDLQSRYQDLKTQESRLEDATRDIRVNGGSVFSQIDRVAQAREALGAVNTRMTDALRKELDADQLAKLQTLNY